MLLRGILDIGGINVYRTNLQRRGGVARRPACRFRHLGRRPRLEERGTWRGMCIEDCRRVSLSSWDLDNHQRAENISVFILMLGVRHTQCGGGDPQVRLGAAYGV